MSVNSPPLPESSIRPTMSSPGGRVLLASLGAAVAGYFVIRGWLGAILVLAGGWSMWQGLVHREQLKPLLADPGVRWLLVSLAAPLTATMLTNAWHGRWDWRAVDGAVRFVFAGALFLELARRRADFSRIAGFAFPAAVALCAIWIFLVPVAPRYFWGTPPRAATYFMDPLTLSQHAMIAGFVCLFLWQPGRREGRLAGLAMLAAFALALAVALETQSRTGWIMVPLLGLIWVARLSSRPAHIKVALSASVVAAACALAYAGSPIVQMRIDHAWTQLLQYRDGTSMDTSIGVRLSLFRIALWLFEQRPWLGWGFGPLPDPATVPELATFYSAAVREMFVGAGVHNEFLAALMRMGLAGGVSRLLLFGVPLWLFARACRQPPGPARTSGYLGIVLVVGYITAGLTSEVTNLIYTGSFYGLLVAAFAAGTVRRETA